MKQGGRFKSPHYAEGEKLTWASKNGNQLSVALPAWMKQRLREISEAEEISISRYVIDVLKDEWGIEKEEKK